MDNFVSKSVTGGLCTIVLAIAISACADTKSDLHVLYVGDHPDRVEQSPSARNIYRNAQGEIPEWHRGRTASFEHLLSQHFTDVTVVYSDEYTESISDNYDVTIFGDLPVAAKAAVYERDENSVTTAFEPAEYLSPKFDNASVLIGFVSPAIGQPLELKMDWLCLCLDAHAHNLETKHPIFNYPNKVDLTITSQPTPESYDYYYNGRDLGETIPMWRVQTTGYVTERGFQPGMVSSANGFSDAPDGEVIAAGVNTKSVSAVSLARHGNYFHWGFSARPDEMTDEAKRVFINTIHYIAKYDGQSAYSRRPYRARTRDSVLDIAHQVSYDTYSDYIETQVQSFEFLKNRIENRQEQGERLSFAERKTLSQDGPDIPSESEWLNDRVKNAFPEQLFERFGTNRDDYLKYYEKNLEFLVPGSGKYQYVVDADVESLNIANRDPQVLNVAISWLEEDTGDSRARSILERYTAESFDTAAEWREWFDKNADRFYFTDLDGHRFEVVPEPAGD